MLLFLVACAFGVFAELVARRAGPFPRHLTSVRRGFLFYGVSILALRELGEYALHRFQTDPVGDDPPIHLAKWAVLSRLHVQWGPAPLEFLGTLFAASSLFVVVVLWRLRADPEAPSRF